MPTVLERPGVIETRPPELEPPRPPRRPVRSFRWLRWAGWLLAAGAVVLVVVLAMNATADDGVVAEPATVPDHLVVAITADPKPRTPAPGAPAPVDEGPLGFGTEATVTPLIHTRLVKHAPGVIDYPNTQFMEEATVTPATVTPATVTPLVGPAEGLDAARQADAARWQGLADFYAQ